MLDCSRCIQKLSEYIDETLGAREATRVRDHLKHCSPCRTEYDALLAIREVLRAAPIPLARPGLWRSVELTLRMRSAPRPRRHPALLPLRGLAWGIAGILLLVLGTMLRFAPAHTPPREAARAVVAQATGAEAGGPISMDALISLHARQSASHPLSDAGRLHYLGSTSEQADLQYDGKLDIH